MQLDWQLMCMHDMESADIDWDGVGTILVIDAYKEGHSWSVYCTILAIEDGTMLN